MKVWLKRTLLKMKARSAIKQVQELEAALNRLNTDYEECKLLLRHDLNRARHVAQAAQRELRLTTLRPQ